MKNAIQIACVTAIVVTAGSAMAGTLPWVFHDADPGEYMGMFSSIELDSSGRPHISYMGVEGNMIYTKYAHYDDRIWQHETIAPVGGNFTVGTSIAIDAQNNPHVTFAQIHPTWALKYARRDEASWSLESIEEQYQVGYRSSLVLAADSNPRVIYGKSSGFGYAYRDNAGWNVEPGPGYGVLVQGLDGTIQAVTWAHDWLHSSSYSQGTWSTPQLVTRGGFGLDVAIDTTGRMHVAHQTLGSDELYYSVYDGDSWTTELVDGPGNVFGHAQVGLALDRQGRPKISYLVHDEDHTGGAYVQFAEWTGSQWSVERLIGERTAGSYGTSLAVDDIGRAYITYYSTENDQGLRVAIRGPTRLSFDNQAVADSNWSTPGNWDDLPDPGAALPDTDTQAIVSNGYTVDVATGGQVSRFVNLTDTATLNVATAASPLTGDLTVTETVTVGPTATLNVHNTLAALRVSTSGMTTLGSSATVNADMTALGGTLDIGPNAAVNGSVDINGATTVVGDNSIVSGTVTLRSGSLTVPSGVAFNANVAASAGTLNIGPHAMVKMGIHITQPAPTGGGG